MGMVCTGCGDGLDVDGPIAVLSLDDWDDGVFLAARFSHARMWNDGRSSTGDATTNSGSSL